MTTQDEDTGDAHTSREVDPHELNPSGRLYLYLRHVDDAGNTRMDQCLANYLKISRSDLPSLFAAAAEISTFPEQIRATLQDDPDATLVPFVTEELEKADAAIAWSESLQGEADRFRSHYDDGTLRILEAWSRELNKRQRSKPETVTRQLSEVRELLDAVARDIRDDVDIDPRVRAILVRHINALVTSIDQFYVGGVEALLDELDRLTGVYIRDPRVSGEIHRRPGWGQRLSQVAMLIGAIGTAIHGIEQIAPAVVDFLQLPSAVILAPPSDLTPDDVELA